MNVHQGIPGLRSLPPGTVLSVGNFDGIHIGHQRLLKTMREIARERRASGLAVVTFEPHPLTVLRPEIAPPRLTPPDIKRELLAAEGVDHLVLLPPEPAVLNLEAEAFWHLLRDEVRPVAIVEGQTFNFGKGRAGTIERLADWCAQSDITLHVVDPVRAVLGGLWDTPISSSMIRWLIAHGRMRDVATALGRSYVLEGTVIKGAQRGRELGVPTANLQCPEQMIPLEGVYAGRCIVNGVAHGVGLSIGTNPTFGENACQIEAHLLDYSSDLYGQTIRVQVLDWLRDQQRFTDVPSLMRQIHRDLQRVRGQN